MGLFAPRRIQDFYKVIYYDNNRVEATAKFERGAQFSSCSLRSQRKLANFSGFNLIVVAAVALLFVLQGVLAYVVMRTSKRITKFFNGKGGKSIEKVLEFEMNRMKKTENDIKNLMDNVKWIEDISKRSVHKVGVIRFNPFRGSIGGDQSFSIAMLDWQDDGVVVSSLHAPDGTRVYAKPILRGKSKYQLTQEENEAIKRAAT